MPQTSGATRPIERGGRHSRRVDSVAAIVIYVGLLAINVYFLMVKPAASWDRKIGLLLGILGVYTFAFAFLSQTDVFKQLPSLDENLTSPNLFDFASANFVAIGSLFLALSAGLRQRRELQARKLMDRTANPLLLLFAGLLALLEAIARSLFTLLRFVLTFAFVGFYLVVVAPIAYTAYFVVSIFVRDLITEAVAHRHGATIRNLLVAIPSLVFSLVLNASFLV
jgi:hypothetical protein